MRRTAHPEPGTRIEIEAAASRFLRRGFPGADDSGRQFAHDAQAAGVVQVLVLTLSRELLDYSQQDLADRLTDEAVKEGDYQTVCDVWMVRRWESGDVVWPQERYRILLERVFGKPVSEHGFVRRWTRTPLGWTLVA